MPKLILPSAWLLSGQSLLGAFNQDIEANPSLKYEYVLNLETHILYNLIFPANTIDLKVNELHLLSSLINAGEKGLYIEHVKQLDIELEQLERADYTNPKHAFVSENLMFTDSHLDRLNMLKMRLNKKLRKLNILILVKRHEGNWYLGNKEGKTITLILEKTVWPSHKKIPFEKNTPKNLSEQLQLVWQCLWEHAPAFVNWQTIATVLPKEEWKSEQQRMKKVSDTINKLKNAISNTNYLIFNDHCGNYRIYQNNDQIAN